MAKFKSNEIVYHVLMHHINHYKEAKKIFKVDYESHMITTDAANATTGLYVKEPDMNITFEN